jgi:hypothetical protein
MEVVNYMKAIRVVSMFAALPMFAQEAQPQEQPAAAETAVTAPATEATPVAAEPAVTAPAMEAQPAAAEPAVTAPATEEATPAAAEPAVTAPATEEATPVAAEPAVTAPTTEAQPVVAETAVTVPATEGQPGLPPPATAAKPKEKIFDILARAMAPRGIAEVNNPDVGSFVPVVSNRAYPLGSAFRTGPNSTVVVNFSFADGIQLMENTEVRIAVDEKNPDARAVKLIRGRLLTFMKDNMPEDIFSVSTPNATCKSLAGRADIELTAKDGNEEFQVATITGTLVIEGLQFSIPALRAANTVNVLTAPNRTLSRLISEKGDFKVVLDNGTAYPVSYDMSPRAVIKIWRENAPVGGRTIVSTLVVGPSGTARHRFVYAVGRDALSTGELVDQAILEQQEKTLRTLGGALGGQAPTNGQEQKPLAEEKKPVEIKKPAELKIPAEPKTPEEPSLPAEQPIPAETT